MVEETPADRLRTALELLDVGVAMSRARLRREHPDATEDEVEAQLRLWLQTPAGEAP